MYLKLSKLSVGSSKDNKRGFYARTKITQLCTKSGSFRITVIKRKKYVFTVCLFYLFVVYYDNYHLLKLLQSFPCL